MPLFAEEGIWVDAGALMFLRNEQIDTYRLLATYVDKILKEAADPPVEQPIKFELVINLKAAKQIGQTIKPNALARAN